MTATTIQQEKRTLRTVMRLQRHDAHTNNPNAANKLSAVFTAHIKLEPKLIIGSYLAFRDEMDPAPLAAALHAQGHPIALPRIIGKRRPLHFHLYADGDPLASHELGLREPLPTAPSCDPDILLIPLLAFDLHRNRLGYGGGYYDHTIADIRTRKPVITIGIAYAAQQVALVPVGPHDISLDKVVTELNVF